MVQGFLKFDNMNSNAYILVLSRFLAVIIYWTNLVLLIVFAANDIVKAVAMPHFMEAIHFLIDPYYQVLSYLMIMCTISLWIF